MIVLNGYSRPPNNKQLTSFFPLMLKICRINIYINFLGKLYIIYSHLYEMKKKNHWNTSKKKLKLIEFKLTSKI